MLPDYLVLPRYAVSAARAKQNTVYSQAQPDDGCGALSQQGQADSSQQISDMADYEQAILSGRSWAGQSCNSLLEERDRHLKARIFCAAKIETFANVLDTLAQQKKVDELLIKELMAKKAAQVSEQSEKIWLNLLTAEKTAPLFYQFEEQYCEYKRQ